MEREAIFSDRSEEGKVSKVLASIFAYMLSKVGRDADPNLVASKPQCRENP